MNCGDTFMIKMERWVKFSVGNTKDWSTRRERAAHRGGGAGLRDLWHLKDDRTSRGQSGYCLWRKPWDMEEGLWSSLKRSEGLVRNFRWWAIWFVFRKFNQSSVRKENNRREKDTRQRIEGAMNYRGLGERVIKVRSSSGCQEDKGMDIIQHHPWALYDL